MKVDDEQPRFIVVNRWLQGNQETGTWTAGDLHGFDHPTLFKTWKNAHRQASGASRSRRPGRVLLFEVQRLPLVTNPAQVARLMKRPKVEVVADASEHEIAERMACAWAIYAQECR